MWNRVEVWIDGKLSVMEVYSKWEDANTAADNFEETYPKAEVQLWTRER